MGEVPCVPSHPSPSSPPCPVSLSPVGYLAQIACCVAPMITAPKRKNLIDPGSEGQMNTLNLVVYC